MPIEGNNQEDLLQQIADLKLRQAQVQRLIDTHTAMLKKLGPLYDKAMQQLEQALETKLEIDTILGYTVQLITEVEAKLEHLSKDR